MAETVCDGATGLRYPVAEILRIEARELHAREYELIDWDAMAATGSFTPDGRAYVQAVEAALTDVPPVQQDLMLLTLLDVAAGPKGDVMVNLTTASPSAVFDRFVAVLDRYGLDGQAGAMRQAYAAFDPWEGTPESRRLQWTDGVGNITGPDLLQVLKATSEVYLAARPTAMDQATALLEADETLFAQYATKRDEIGDDTALDYLVGLIWECADLTWWSPEEAKAALDPLPQPVREIYVLNMFLGEAYNGGVHQFFSNSSGALVPEAAAIFDKYDYDAFAEGLRDGMAVFEGDYPVDTQARRTQMQGFGPVQDARLDQLSDRVEDRTVEALMVRIAKEGGIWPE